VSRSVVALLTKQADVPSRPQQPTRAAGARCNATAPLSDGSGRFWRVPGRPGVATGGKDHQAQLEAGSRKVFGRKHTSAFSGADNAMPRHRAGSGRVPGIRLIAAVLTVERGIGHRCGQTVREVVLGWMRFCHRGPREAEGQQDKRKRKPAQHAPAPPTASPVVAYRDHSAPPETQAYGYSIALRAALIQIKRTEFAILLRLAFQEPEAHELPETGCGDAAAGQPSSPCQFPLSPEPVAPLTRELLRCRWF